jgi:hypothetical protein
MNLFWLFQIQSLCILIILFLGIRYVKLPVKNRIKHRQFMLIGMSWDLLLILQIELSRHAVEKAMQVMKNPMILNIHVSFAVSVVVFYVLMFISGKKSLKLPPHAPYLKIHKKLGMMTMILRVLTFITSFLINL